MTPEPGSGPRRTCVGCRTTRHPDELIRIVRTADGNLQIGRTLPGRGAWLCRSSPTCTDQAIRRGGFARTLRASISPQAMEDLRSQLSALPQA